jgi:hypothetical protein
MENLKIIEETILIYTSAWNEVEKAAILEKINACWAPGGSYTDKLTDTIVGTEAISDLIFGSHEQMGPRTFQLVGAPEVHHQNGRFRWLALRTNDYPVEGMDYFEFDEHNRITRIVGFF